MPDWPILVSFFLAALVVCIVPGSAVSAVVGTTLARGLKAGLRLELGIQLGRLIMVLLVAAAVQAVTAFMAAAFDWIKYAGVAYLIWLGWRFLSTDRFSSDDAPSGEKSLGANLVSGLLVTWTNPKAFLFFGAFLPQFVDPRFAAWPQVIVLGLMEMAIAATVESGYAILAAQANRRVTGPAARWINRIAGAILIGAAIWLAFAHRS